MITVRLKGGMGNQMFQYALGRVLAIKNSTTLGLDTSFFNFNFKNVIKRSYDLDVFSISATITNVADIPCMVRLYDSKIINSLFSLIRKIVQIKGQEKSFNFDKDILTATGSVYLDGYFQSPNYFADYEDVIRKDFTLKHAPDEKVKVLYAEIKNADSLCVHVRRGDFVGSADHEVVTTSYYKEALAILQQQVSISTIYVFSDDIQWCKENLSFKLQTIFVDDTYRGGKGEWHMYLMSACKHFIIPNSTFAWWGAWLCTYEKKVVICPKRWLNNTSIDTSDLIPEDWIKI